MVYDSNVTVAKVAVVSVISERGEPSDLPQVLLPSGLETFIVRKLYIF
jgi:hypothetical protein